MQNFHMYMCDSCGRSHEKPGVCMFCQVPLTSYAKEAEIQREYQTADQIVEHRPKGLINSYKWYA